MMGFSKGAAACAAALLAVQPCMAADAFRADGPRARTSSGFAGLTIRVPLDRSGVSRKATARLQLTTRHDLLDTRGASVAAYRPAGVEIGLDRQGRAAYFVGGENVRHIEERLNAKGGKTTWIIVGGVVLAVVLLAAVVRAQPTAGPPKGAF